MPLPTGDEYIWALCDSFGAEYNDPMTEIMNVKHTGIIKEYQKIFNSVMTRLDILTGHAISIFLNNLKPELSSDVRVGNPSTLPQAYYLSRLQEANFASQSREIWNLNSKSSMNRGSSGHNSSNWQKDSSSRFKKPSTVIMDNNKKRRLAPAEMDEKRARGICFFCDENLLAINARPKVAEGRENV